MKNSEDVIVFGGSFDPVTIAHVAIAQEVKKITKKKIIFMPVSDGYGKRSLKASFIDRYRMLEIATSCGDGLEVSDLEEEFYLRYKRQPKTIETLELLQKRDVEPALLLGLDNYLNIDRWYKGKKIKEDFKIYVYPRGVQDVSDEIVIKGVKLYDISSSKIKEAIVDHIYDDLDPKVKEYIITHHLYQD